MKHSWLILPALLLLTACERQYEPNPDPNHTHADFAVWIDGKSIDFSGPEYMSGLSTDDSTHDEESEYHHQHYHLHDNVGHVIHVHKTGLPLQEFFDSLSYRFPRDTRMFVTKPTGDGTWSEMDFSLQYEFSDMDMLLFTNSQDDEVVTQQQEHMTQDACLYSKTCPWRGDPPAENCIADPAVPCVVPEEDL